jgi:ABC-type iron transport system FetAB ATPase subunit
MPPPEIVCQHRMQLVQRGKRLQHTRLDAYRMAVQPGARVPQRFDGLAETVLDRVEEVFPFSDHHERHRIGCRVRCLAHPVFEVEGPSDGTELPGQVRQRIALTRRGSDGCHVSF